jgi:hypothetical protein
MPKFLVDSVGDENQFRVKLKEILIYNLFYIVDKFFKYCQDLQLRDTGNTLLIPVE